jgi:hypothetical protein
MSFYIDDGDGEDVMFLRETEYYDHNNLENVDNIMDILLTKIRYRYTYIERNFEEQV